MSNQFRIRELRRVRGLTQAQLAFRLDLKSPSTVAMWENGVRRPPSTLLPGIARARHCSIVVLYAGGAGA